MANIEDFPVGEEEFSVDRGTVSLQEQINTVDVLSDTTTNICIPANQGRRGTAVALLTEPVEYSWTNINVFAGPCIQNRDGSISKCDTQRYKGQNQFLSKLLNMNQNSCKHILRDVTGVAHTGEILALMGSSGAGKTTLMNILMFRTSLKMKISGERCINGVPISAGFVNAISGYVQQDDLFIGALTVKEHLTFQALFRMDRKFTLTERELRVVDVINECGLQKCMNSKIGVPGIKKGISGGERKRLAFASEMVTDPAILFCDEPTSGLDYYTAQKIVMLLQTMARAGKTIICTIHQPSSDIFSIFDNLLLMADGRTAFHGTREEALKFFAEQGMFCPTTHNPADFFLEHLSTVTIAEDNISPADRIALIEAICNCYDQSKLSAEIMSKVAEPGRKSYEFQALEHKIMEQESKSIVYKASSWNQNKALLKRAWLANWRNTTLVGIRITQLVVNFLRKVVACIFCLIYYGQNLDRTGIRNINGALFLFIVHMTFSSIFGVINTFCEELPLFLREQSNRLYRTTFYFVSKTIADTPIHFLFPFLFGLIVYFAIGLVEDVHHFFWCVLILTLVVNVSCSYGYMVSCASGNVQTALTLVPPLSTPMLIFGGVFVNSKGVPLYLGWIQYISWIYYATEAIMLNQWDDSYHAKCNQTSKTCRHYSSATILAEFDFDKDNFQRDMWCLVALSTLFRIMAYIALQIKVLLMTRYQ